MTLLHGVARTRFDLPGLYLGALAPPIALAVWVGLDSPQFVVLQLVAAVGLQAGPAGEEAANEASSAVVKEAAVMASASPARDYDEQDEEEPSSISSDSANPVPAIMTMKLAMIPNRIHGECVVALARYQIPVP